MTNAKPRPILLAACLLAPLLAQAGERQLDVQGLDASRVTGATLMVAAYRATDPWLGKPSWAQRFALAELKIERHADGDRVSLTLSGLPDALLSQPLALTVVQDANANGRLDRNAFGMPTEPYGFSNDATGSFGPPSFEAARFEWAAGQVVRLKLN